MSRAPKLSTVYGTSPDLANMEKMIGKDFLCGTAISLVASDCGTFHTVHNSKGATSLVVVQKGRRFAFGVVAK